MTPYILHLLTTATCATLAYAILQIILISLDVTLGKKIAASAHKLSFKYGIQIAGLICSYFGGEPLVPSRKNRLFTIGEFLPRKTREKMDTSAIMKVPEIAALDLDSI